MTTLETIQNKNLSILNQRISNILNRDELITFFKRAKISLCCDLIDDEAKNEFCDYYGYLPLYRNNSGLFELIKIR